MDGFESRAPLDDASAHAQRLRLLRAWTTGGSPDLAQTRPGISAGLAAGTALSVLLAAGLGIGGAISGFRRDRAAKTTRVETASASRDLPVTTSSSVPPPVTAPPPRVAAAPPPAATPVTAPPATAPPPVETTPAFAYTAPRPAAKAVNGAVTVTWPDLNPPSGAVLKAVRVTLQPASGGGAPLEREVAPTHKGTTIAGAANGTPYKATLTAIDGEGRAGPPSVPSETVTPSSSRPSPPGKVASLVATPVNGGVTVTWDPPTTDGGSPVQRYQVTANPGARTIEAPWGVRSATLSDLGSGTAYTLSVQAVTDEAWAEPVTSAPVTPATSGPGRPDPPSAPNVTIRGDRSWTATFTPGAGAGGEGVKTMTFTVVPLPNDGSAAPAVSPALAPPRPGSTTQVVVNGKGLNPALAYTFVVVAWNGEAASEASPASPPGRVPATTTTTARAAAATTPKSKPASTPTTTKTTRPGLAPGGATRIDEHRRKS